MAGYDNISFESNQQALVADWLRFGLSGLDGCDGI